jgi:opacity protein-like surface antigen
MKNMKNKLIGVMAVCALSPVTYASSHNYFDAPYLGAEVIQTNQDYKAGYGKKVFKKNPQDYSVFGGFNFTRHFGVEVGYDFQPKRNKTANLAAGDTLPGNLVLTNAGSISSSIKQSNPYVGLFGETTCHVSGMGKMKFAAMVGASVSHVKATLGSFNPAAPAVLTPAQANASNLSFSKTKVVPMIKLIATYMVTDAVGIRVSGNYRNMASFKMHAREAGKTGLLKLKDSYGVGLGLTYSFCGM